MKVMASRFRRNVYVGVWGNSEFHVSFGVIARDAARESPITAAYSTGERRDKLWGVVPAQTDSLISSKENSLELLYREEFA